MSGAYIWNANPKLWNPVPPNSSGWEALRDYLLDKSGYVYWSTTKLISEIEVGDRAYIWRNTFKKNPVGVIAVGRVIERPRELSAATRMLFARPDRLDAAGWAEGSAPTTWKTGIKVEKIYWNSPIGADLYKARQGSVVSLAKAIADDIDKLT